MADCFLHSGEPPLAPGSVRLYRVEPGFRSRRPDWVLAAQRDNGHLVAEGRWFSRDPAALVWYREDQGRAVDPQLVFVDVPQETAESYRVRNVPAARPFSRDPDSEFFLPREIAAQRRSLGSAYLLPPERCPPDRMTADARRARVLHACAKAAATSPPLRQRERD